MPSPAPLRAHSRPQRPMEGSGCTQPVSEVGDKARDPQEAGMYPWSQTEEGGGGLPAHLPEGRQWEAPEARAVGDVPTLLGSTLRPWARCFPLHRPRSLVGPTQP